MRDADLNLTNPMQADLSRYCGAHCRTTGEPCKNYPMPNGRCRMHGGKSTGRPIVNGRYTNAEKQDRREVRELIKSLTELTRNNY